MTIVPKHIPLLQDNWTFIHWGIDFFNNMVISQRDVNGNWFIGIKTKDWQ